MADIEIVVKIPEEMYEWVNDVNKFYDEYGISDFIDLIKNCTLIPNGHGDLIDRKELLKQPIDLANYPSNYVKMAPAIIKAEVPKKRKGTPLEENDCGYNCENWIP